MCAEVDSEWECVPIDAGATDAGANDASFDAGTDAGANDAGVDAGDVARYALAFDGDGDAVVFPTNIGDLGTTFTVETWVKPTSTAGGLSGEGGLVFMHRADCTDFGIEWSGNGDGRTPGTFKFRVYPDNNCPGWVVAQSPTESPIDMWHHVAGVFDGGDLRLYVDGSLVAMANQPAAISWTTNLVGHFAGHDASHPDSRRWGFIGEIDEIRVSDSALYSGATITPPAHFTDEADTIALWLFDEGTGGTTADGSGNAFNGTIQHATWVTSTR
jgi:hypothetical protein